MKNTGNAEMVPDDDNKSIYPLHFDAKISVNGSMPMRSVRAITAL